MSALVWAALLVSGRQDPAPEEWADKGLPVKTGLEGWFDAARQPAARSQMRKPELSLGQPVDAWYDGSGHARHLLQKAADARPSFVSVGRHAAVRFDGQKQHLVATGLKLSSADLTVFVVAIPFSNRGGFRAFLAAGREGANDFQTGLTLDQGPGFSDRFASFNAEGAGFPGAANVLKDVVEFGVLTRLCVTSTAGAGGTRANLDGKPQGARDRAASTLAIDRITVGARFYELGGPPQVRGFLEGDIAEILMYSRILTDDERASVDKYLSGKHGDRRKVPVPRVPGSGKPLVRVPDPPPVQVFVPGFSVRALPVDLVNVNNVLYRDDGKLVALGYDGTLFLLTDTDGDGLEDKADLFWDGKGGLRAPIGMALTPASDPRGPGVIVASKGKCSLIVDADRDGQGDKEIVVASGWKELPHGADALGVAVDPKDGSVLFGLGCADFTNAYQVAGGASRFDLQSERGTILRVSPDFKTREIVATGIRFPVGLRFSAAGDLFATDQEGATWLPNGNPLDELLHIEKGRHYGFPPRHPQHLPGVIDEPSVFDYAPQHQSTCGLNFNEPVNGGPIAGPAWWRSDVFVAGYSRGKLYRTKLVKTAGGYVAQNEILASLGTLAADVCLSPRGDLVVAVHSGGPDWGSGPQGKGKLYQIRTTGRDLPQPVAAWPQGPQEVRVAFDRPLESAHLQNLAGKVAIEYGRHVAAGDRFEALRPGYQVVQDQLSAPRFDLPVFSVQVTNDRRTLVLSTAPHPEAAGYALTLPGLGRPERGKEPAAQVPETDLAYDLSGAEAVWQSKDGSDALALWLPHLDLTAARGLTRGSAAHDDFWGCTDRPGTLTLRAKLDLWDLLRPAVQPGSRIDYTWPEERVTLVFRAPSALEVASLGETKRSSDRAVEVGVKPRQDAPMAVELKLATGQGPADISVTWRTAEDDRPRALPLRRVLLPWAALKKEAATVARKIPELEGGDWRRGRDLYFSEQAACFKCHAIGGLGGRIGPDLTNLPHRDYASVLRDVSEPNFAINPDYLSYVVALTDGRVLTGVLQSDEKEVRIADTQGQVTAVPREQVEKVKGASLSIMPEGLAKALGPDKLRDLLTFLLQEPPRMPDYGKGTPPAPRSRKEVEAVLAGSAAPAKGRPLHAVLVAGRKDHGPGEHDYPAWQTAWARLFAMADGVKVTTATDWPSPEELRTADVLVFYQQGTWTPDRARDLDAYLARGGGAVYLHYAVDGGRDSAGFAQRIGLAWQGGRSKFRHGPLDLRFEAAAKHPVLRNLDKVHFHDESYWNLVGDPASVTLLASAVEDGQPRPLVWTLEPKGGRVFVSILGHYSWTFDDPIYRVLILRGTAWAAKEPVDRWNDLVTPGARIAD